MHLLAGETGRIDEGDQAVDLGQSPGDIVVLSSADSELAALARAAEEEGYTGLRLANLMRFAHPLSVDLYADRTVSATRLVVVRAMGGAGYWPYGLERLRALARAGGPALLVVPGEDRWDAGLEAFSTVDPETARRLWRYFVEGGAENARRALRFMAWLTGVAEAPPPAEVLPHAGIYAGAPAPAGKRPCAAIVFYRAVLHGGSTAPIDALIAALDSEGLDARAIFVPSLKDREAEAFLTQAFAAAPPAIVLNTTAFAVSRIGDTHGGTVLDRPGRPVLQVVLAGSSEEAWRDSPRGLSPKDLIMNVVLPEVDGRILTRAVSFKVEAAAEGIDSRTATYRPVGDRIAFVARQAAAWVSLAGKPAKDRRIAIVLSNYPNRDGRIANGVGLDTPESAVVLAEAMRAAGYDLGGFPANSEALMAHLLAGETNSLAKRGEGRAAEHLALSAYRDFLASLPEAAQAAIAVRWGAPETDPFFADGGFSLAVHRFGNVAIGIQPSRGYDIDPKATYHDPDLVPPYRYLAFHAWVRQAFQADAVVHLGKHGNLEWLPGKALGLSADCWPEIALGPLPLIYPFIVNDPGEGAQAKRRASAVIVDHLMPPMTRAGVHGGLAELETLVDEYYLAAGVDPRRRARLERDILDTAERHGIDRDLGLVRDDAGASLRALDAHLCEIKEMQIRDGLHVLGRAPEGRLRVDTLAAIARVQRTGGRAEDRALPRALAEDLSLNFDPFDCDLAAPWHGPRPDLLASASEAPWRTAGDTVERLEDLAARLIAGEVDAAGLPQASAVLAWIADRLAPALDGSGEAETSAVLAALDGRFVPPGPSGAPTRGRPEVLPTGRNFYSVDVRAVPTAAAWEIGRAAADALALRYFQDEGEWPRSVAMSAWGTANMRTGGDDIAQAMALIGAKPEWEPATGRVTGFTILPLAALGRPRIDVTLKISGMFRDAFPTQIDLLDSAIRAIAELDEDKTANPIAATAKENGLARIFGSKPGAYGAGMQAMIDEGIWTSRADFAETLVAWGGYAYGSGLAGEMAAEAFRGRLAATDAVLHNQDNREHDILDSDDYYQFQGGLAAAVETFRGRAPRLYHGDHARPEKPVVRPLQEEIGRVVRGRAANPKWLAGVMRHGYKGAFEIAATVDYLFAYAALTDAVGDHHFDALYDAYVGVPEVVAFMTAANPDALAEMASRLREAIDRGLWRPRVNSAYDRLSGLISGRRQAAE